MCGILACFVGCELVESCPKAIFEACSDRAYRSAFSNWDKKSSVRSKPRREIQDNVDLRRPFPPSLVPISSHPLVIARGEEVLAEILFHHFARFLMFTQALELLIVNEVTKAIGLQRSVVAVPANMALDAHILYTDEGYHAQFSFDLLRQLECKSGYKYRAEYTPRCVRALWSVLKDLDSDSDKRLMHVVFVIVTEMMITSMLKDERNREGVPSALDEAWGDHAADEARHHLFYREFLKLLWSQSDDTTRRKIGSWMPAVLRAITIPDTPSVMRELEAIRFSPCEIAQIVSDTYGGAVQTKFAAAAASGLVEVLRELGAFRDSAIIDSFLVAEILGSSCRN